MFWLFIDCASIFYIQTSRIAIWSKQYWVLLLTVQTTDCVHNNRLCTYHILCTIIVFSQWQKVVHFVFMKSAVLPKYDIGCLHFNICSLLYSVWWPERNYQAPFHRLSNVSAMMERQAVQLAMKCLYYWHSKWSFYKIEAMKVMDCYYYNFCSNATKDQQWNVYIPFQQVWDFIKCLMATH